LRCAWRGGCKLLQFRCSLNSHDALHVCWDLVARNATVGACECGALDEVLNLKSLDEVLNLKSASLDGTNLEKVKVVFSSWKFAQF